MIKQEKSTERWEADAITILCVGKLKKPIGGKPARNMPSGWERFCRFSIVEVEEERVPDKPSPAQLGGRHGGGGPPPSGKAGPQTLLVPLCIEGKAISSPELAAWLDEQAVAGRGDVAL